jgi:hypothetical protein
MKATNSIVAATAASSSARLRPAWYIITIAFDQRRRSGAIASGTPRRRAMTITGMGRQKASSRSKAPPGKASIRSWVSAPISGASALIRRLVKARRTSERSRVWRGGSSSSMECASTA